ncbi:Uncharacterised protein [Staphylococcus aureus]|nr:Uncharacterised protein [Staphylococcus aureus]
MTSNTSFAKSTPPLPPFFQTSVKAIRTLFSLAQDFTYSTSASVSCINALIATTGSTPNFLILLT